MNRFLTIAIVITLLFSCSDQKKDLHFEKVVFNTTGSFGIYPDYHLEMDKSKNIKLYVERARLNQGRPFLPNEDSTKIGYFTGIATDTSFAKLTTAFNKIGIDTATLGSLNGDDGTMITIIAYYDGKRKYLKALSPSQKSYKLISALAEICRKTPLKRTTQQFKIEE